MRALLIALLLSLALISPVGASQKHPRVDRCRHERTVSNTITCLARGFDAPGSPRRALSVAKCESGLYVRATNGTHRGLFQQANKYWLTRYRHFARPLGLGQSAYNPLTNTIVSLRLARQAGTWSRDWSCA